MYSSVLTKFSNLFYLTSFSPFKLCSTEGMSLLMDLLRKSKLSRSHIQLNEKGWRLDKNLLSAKTPATGSIEVDEEIFFMGNLPNLFCGEFVKKPERKEIEIFATLHIVRRPFLLTFSYLLLIPCRVLFMNFHLRMPDQYQ